MFISLREMAQRAGLSKSTIWRFRKRYPDFPKPIEIEPTIIRWVREEFDAWLLSHRQGDRQ